MINNKLETRGGGNITKENMKKRFGTFNTTAWERGGNRTEGDFLE